jgi:hypothetical protein
MNQMEKFKKAWPETAVGLVSIVAGILLLLFSAIAVAAPTSAHAGGAQGGRPTLVERDQKPSAFSVLLNGCRRPRPAR